jgi:hypothetical protein
MVPATGSSAQVVGRAAKAICHLHADIPDDGRTRRRLPAPLSAPLTTNSTTKLPECKRASVSTGTETAPAPTPLRASCVSSVIGVEEARVLARNVESQRGAAARPPSIGGEIGGDEPRRQSAFRRRNSSFSLQFIQ